MFKILICDDEKDIVSGLKIYFESEGYSVLTACNGRQAVSFVETESDIDLILMDIMMPVMNGIEALVKIREKSNLPVILLTAKSEDTDKVVGLNVGADDYITKPFNPMEVLARVKAQIRRYKSLGGNSAPQADETTFVNGGIIVDDKTKTVTVDGEEVSLTPKEYDMLKFFINHVGEVFSPKDIYRNVWNNDPYGAENTITVHVRHLREKIEIDPANPRYLKVVWGHGYKMDAQ
ncbi:MAG: response regulator transcription factor [Clostridia bacterium]|nr:response regulator transcription factor [Clostridia bacterium]